METTKTTNKNNNSSSNNNNNATTTTTGNNNNKFNLDHVYCHTSETNFVGRNNSGGGHHQPDVIGLLKENKQLKAVLLIHLELIQEQSEQLMAKEKIVAALKDETEFLRHKIQKYEKNLTNNSRKLINSAAVSIKSNLSPSPTGHFNEEKKGNLLTTSVVVNEISAKRSIKNESTVHRTTRSTPTPTSDEETKYKICDENNFGENSPSIIGQSNGKLISKIILHRVSIPESMISPNSIKEETTNEKYKEIEEPKSPVLRSSSYKKSPQYVGKSVGGGKPTSLLQLQAAARKSPSPVEIKSEEIDDSFSCGSSGQEFSETNASHQATSSAANKRKLSSCSSTAGPNYNVSTRRKKRIQTKNSGFISSKRKYPLREWLEDEMPLEEALNKEEEEAMKADAPMLEIPKWTVKDFTGLYCIEGTEDLSDETFLKRHAKLEHDEKRRKKWDVQRIREIRTIERLKRRHCKDELQQQNTDQEEFSSFYPSPHEVKFIQVTENLPVQAFGEQIPKLSTSEFQLPWLHHQHKSNSSADVGTNSSTSFVFLKKRRRLQPTTITPRKQRIATASQNLTGCENIIPEITTAVMVASSSSSDLTK